MSVIEHVSIHEAVYRNLRDRLMRGDFLAGQTLELQALADELGTSTMPVREALRRLAEQRAIERTRSRSMCVPHLSLERLEDICRCRKLMEGALTEWAAPHLAQADIAELRALSRQITAALQTPATVAEGLQHNQAFHFRIYGAARSPSLLAMVEALWLQSGPYLRAARALMHSDLRPDADLHGDIVDALAAGDGVRARKALVRDVSWAFDRLRATPQALSAAA